MVDGILGGVGDFFGGAKDFLLGGGKYADSTAINPQYGVPEADVRQAGINTLANVSALLLAAGQPMSGAQRAQMLAGIGPAFGGMTTDIYKASQSRLMLAQQQQAMQEIQEINAINKRRLEDPEGLAKQMDIKVDRVKVLDARTLRDIAKQITIKEAAVSPEDRRKKQLEIQQLGQQIAIGKYIPVQGSLFKLTPTGVERATPAPDYGFGETDVPQRPPAGVTTPGMPTPPAAAVAPGAPPVVAPAAAVAPAEQPQTDRFASINRNLDYNRAFGVSGAYNWAAGKVRGFVGSTDKATQEAGKAISEVDTLRNSLIASTASEVAGKNLRSTQTRIQDLLPSTASIFTSPAEAVNKLSSIKSLIESDMNDLLFIGSERSQASPADKTKAAQAYRDLRRNRDNINVVLGSLTAPSGEGAQQQTPQQAQPTSRFREGQTAVNPQTGARLVFRGGRWEPM
jgi:hypothetical protein